MLCLLKLMLLSVSPLKEKGWWLLKFLKKDGLIFIMTLWANYSIREDLNTKCSNCLNVNVYVKYSVCA